MPQFGRTSSRRLATCHPLLQHLFREVVKEFDCSVIRGWDGPAVQDALYKAGKSQKRWPKSKHNNIQYVKRLLDVDGSYDVLSIPVDGRYGIPQALAVDVAPWPIDWIDLQQFHLFSGYVLGFAHRLSIPIRWGGDWNMNKRVKDEKWRDLAHFELHGVK